jgi:adenylate cyclase
LILAERLLFPDEIVGRVTLTVVAKLIEDINRRIEALPPQDWTQYDLEMRGWALLSRPVMLLYSTDHNRQEALGCFEQALAGAPDSIPAKIGIAAVLITNVAVGLSPSGGPDEVRAGQLLADILRVNGESAFAHMLMGIFRRSQFRLDGSLIALRVAIGLAPNFSWRSPILGSFGCFSDSRTQRFFFSKGVCDCRRMTFMHQAR